MGLLYFLYASPLTVDALDVRSELQLLRRIAGICFSQKALHAMFCKSKLAKQHCSSLTVIILCLQGCFVRRRLSSIELSLSLAPDLATVKHENSSNSAMDHWTLIIWSYFRSLSQVEIDVRLGLSSTLLELLAHGDRAFPGAPVFLHCSSENKP